MRFINHRLNRRTICLAVALLCLGVWTGCDSIFSSLDDEQGSGSFNVLLTDAPFPFDLVKEANVTITEVQLVPASAEEDGGEDTQEQDEEESTGEAGSDEGSDADKTSDSGIITLKTTWEGDRDEISFNLLELRNGITAELVSDVEIPTGTYSQIRLIVAEEAALVDTNETTYNLKVPSGTETGVKIQLDSLEITDGSVTTTVLDFNLEDSFVARGNINSPADLQGIIFKPVVHLQSVTDGAPEETEEEEDATDETEETDA